MSRTLSLALVIVVALTVVTARNSKSEEKDAPFDWSMIGRDIDNTRSQPFRSDITSRTAQHLAAKWIFTTAGDVSATPAVITEKHHRVGVYFPDWGGRLWKLDGATGQVLWSRSIPDYNGIPNSLSRTSPAFADGMIFVGDLNGNMMGIDAENGDLVWLTRVDPNPATIITTSPIVLGDRLYISTSSNEATYARSNPSYGGCCKWRGSMNAIDTRTGRIVWQTFVLPDNGGQVGGFAGGAFVNPPAIDLNLGLVYGAAGQLYTQPDSVTACLAAAKNNWSESCFPGNAYFNSVVAFDLETGAPRWSFRGAGEDARQLACGNLPASVTWCPPANLFSVWDFAGSGPNVIRTRSSHTSDVVGIGQKSGVYWALNARTGKLLWSTLVGPGSDPGGIQWGTAYDGARIYAAIGHNTGEAYRLVSGEVVTGGSWAALDPSDGHILWQTPDPQGAPDLSALTISNDVLYAGSLAAKGDQMYALDATTGAILWRYHAGGSVVSGPAVVGDTVYWGSGYARTGGVGNNLFFAFSVGGR